jgi:exopolysaccharide production protein ExoZ
MTRIKEIARTPLPANSVAGIQALRFMAALMVVITHVSFFLNSRVDAAFTIWNAGTQGVALFFVISGFVISLSMTKLEKSANAAKHFFLLRIIRIAPLYWLINALKILQILVLPGIAFAQPDALNVVLSIFFIPSRNSNGVIETFYGVGWTLNFTPF